ncbi:hypothetical protein IE53DRAFT_211933 [Violaceomyces palustris]|uniref:Uncharacterized protein n=1 Tax=Violaceomyces palustris TaxID=1673888 RepID=A0ACD0NQP5_9BASI|nr:hypothetical protein IE53DRAFT_211933 [Violaceomyces palustris]
MLSLHLPHAGFASLRARFGFSFFFFLFTALFSDFSPPLFTRPECTEEGKRKDKRKPSGLFSDSGMIEPTELECEQTRDRPLWDDVGKRGKGEGRSGIFIFIFIFFEDSSFDGTSRSWKLVPFSPFSHLSTVAGFRIGWV